MSDAVPADPIRFVIVTGLSGAGKSYAIKCLEDLSYFCVDNLPTTLIPTFAELCAHSSRGIHAIALGVDVREGEYLANMVETIEELQTATDQLIEVVDEHVQGDTLAHAKHAHDKIIPAMTDVRVTGDKLEGLVAADLWPLPTYQEMLFIR